MPAVVLGIDVGYCNTGLLTFTFEDGKWVASRGKVISTSSEKKKRNLYAADDTIRRIGELVRGVRSEFEEVRPAAIAVELPHGGGQSASAIKSMGIATAIVACIVEFTNTPAAYVTPTMVKVALTGKKAASKEECIAGFAKVYPDIASCFTSKRSKSGYDGKFEHIADAGGAFLAAKDSQIIKLMERMA